MWPKYARSPNTTVHYSSHRWLCATTFAVYFCPPIEPCQSAHRSLYCMLSDVDHFVLPSYQFIYGRDIVYFHPRSTLNRATLHWRRSPANYKLCGIIMILIIHGWPVVRQPFHKNIIYNKGNFGQWCFCCLFFFNCHNKWKCVINILRRPAHTHMMSVNNKQRALTNNIPELCVKRIHARSR